MPITADRPVPVAVVGLGWVAVNRHIPSIRRNPHLRLAGVIDRNRDRVQAVAARFGLSRTACSDRLGAAEWMDEVGAVVIGAPPMSHSALAIEALAMGKHVITEKPFAMSLGEGEAMAAAAEKAGKVLAVVHNFQFGRAAQKLRRDLAMGKLGELRRVAAVQLGNPRRRLPSWYESLPLGLFYDESPHFFYLLRWLAGGRLDLRQAYGVPSRDGLNTPAMVSLAYAGEGGLPVTMSCQFDCALSEWLITVCGKEATAVVDIFRDVYIRLPNDGGHGLKDVLTTSAAAVAQHILGHIPNGIARLRGRLDYGNDEVFARFAAAMRGGDGGGREREILRGMSSDDALAVLRLQREAVAEISRI